MIIDEIIRSKRKTIALIVDQEGRVIVRAPLKATDKQINEFVKEKADWIQSKKELADTYPKFQPKEYKSGEGFYLLGSTYPLEIVTDQPELLVWDGKFLLARAVLSTAEEVFTQWYKEQARQVITDRVERYAKLNGYGYKRVRITSARTRWGSCSSKGSLNFNWRLVMAPMRVIDYVVIHELVHTEEKNHSKAYWNKVEILMPDYKERRNWLKNNGHLLNL